MSRSQSSMEFLMTYGWAILLVAVVLATFSLLNVTDTGLFTQERCISTSDFSCEEFALDYDEATNTMILRVNLKNIAGTDVNITKNSFEFSGSIIQDKDFAQDTSGFDYGVDILKNGQIFSLVFDFAEGVSDPSEGSSGIVESASIPTGGKTDLEFTFDYRVRNKDFKRTAVTNMLVDVQ